MLNPLDTHAELQHRVLEALLKVRLANVLDPDELHALAFAAGVQLPSRTETRLQRLRRLAAEARESELRG